MPGGIPGLLELGQLGRAQQPGRGGRALARDGARAQLASAAALQGQAARVEARAGGARPARLGGPPMHLLYPLVLTFVYHVLWSPERVLVYQLGVSAERRLLYSDILHACVVPWVCRASRGAP